VTVEEAMGMVRERARQLKEKWPGYRALLDFYVKVRELQAASSVSVRVDTAKVNKNGKCLPAEEGISLLGKEDFPIDMEVSIGLFRSMCRLGSAANPHFASQVEKIEQALVGNGLDLKELFRGGENGQAIDRAAADRGLDRQVLSFLVRSSTRPSIEAGREQLRGALDPETWRKSRCPVCGSLPTLSLLRGDGGMRYSLCSCCGCQWRIDRMSCPVCGSKEQGDLHYFYGEGESACRIDLCDTCRHYIKTIDYRSLEESDPCLEDLATLHLDVLAAQKGYRRAVPNPWTD
jgi:FdhE protein